MSYRIESRCFMGVQLHSLCNFAHRTKRLSTLASGVSRCKASQSCTTSAGSAALQATEQHAFQPECVIWHNHVFSRQHLSLWQQDMIALQCNLCESLTV